MTDNRKTISLKVVARFLKEKDLEDFMKAYDSNKKTYTLTDRKNGLEKDITPEEKRAMDSYYGSLEKPIRVLAQELLEFWHRNF